MEVNKQLDKMGYNIGLRLIEDFLAKSNTMRRCANFRETGEMIAKVCFVLILNPKSSGLGLGGFELGESGKR